MTSDPVERYLLRASRFGRRARLRPMKVSELFDLSLRVYRTLGAKILVASAVPSLFTLAGFAFLFQYVLPGFTNTKQGTSEGGQVVEASINLLLGILVAGPLVLIGVSLATTYIAPLVSNFMHGQSPDYKAAAEAQWKSAPRMLWVSVRESLFASSGALLGGVLLLISWWMSHRTSESAASAGYVLVLGAAAIGFGGLLALYVINTHALVAPIAGLEGLDARAAARRSRALLKAHPYQGSGYEAVWSLYLLLAMLAVILGIGASALAELAGVANWAAALNLRAMQPILETAVDLVPTYLTLWVTVPVWAVTVTIIYFERRVRLEGYDIEALAADVWQADRESRVRA